ncbi:hypothetical protein [Nocardia gipuzkoensis]
MGKHSTEDAPNNHNQGGAPENSLAGLTAQKIQDTVAHCTRLDFELLEPDHPAFEERNMVQRELCSLPQHDVALATQAAIGILGGRVGLDNPDAFHMGIRMVVPISIQDRKAGVSVIDAAIQSATRSAVELGPEFDNANHRAEELAEELTRATEAQEIDGPLLGHLMAHIMQKWAVAEANVIRTRRQQRVNVLGSVVQNVIGGLPGQPVYAPFGGDVHIHRHQSGPPKQ